MYSVCVCFHFIIIIFNRKTNSRYDTCMMAQEKLHPTCAQRAPENINVPTSNGVVYNPPPACHTIADLCKEDVECR